MSDTLVFIPAWNEEGNLAAVLDESTGTAGRRRLVVDDGSTDRTAEVAREHGAEVLSFGENRGLQGDRRRLRLGARARYASAAGSIRGRSAADSLLLALVRGDASDVAVGSRFVSGEGYAAYRYKPEGSAARHGCSAGRCALRSAGRSRRNERPLRGGEGAAGTRQALHDRCTGGRGAYPAGRRRPAVEEVAGGHARPRGRRVEAPGNKALMLVLTVSGRSWSQAPPRPPPCLGSLRRSATPTGDIGASIPSVPRGLRPVSAPRRAPNACPAERLGADERAARPRLI